MTNFISAAQIPAIESIQDPNLIRVVLYSGTSPIHIGLPAIYDALLNSEDFENKVKTITSSQQAAQQAASLPALESDLANKLNDEEKIELIKQLISIYGKMIETVKQLICIQAGGAGGGGG